MVMVLRMPVVGLTGGLGLEPCSADDMVLPARSLGCHLGRGPDHGGLMFRADIEQAAPSPSPATPPT